MLRGDQSRWLVRLFPHDFAQGVRAAAKLQHPLERELHHAQILMSCSGTTCARLSSGPEGLSVSLSGHVAQRVNTATKLQSSNLTV